MKGTRTISYTFDKKGDAEKAKVIVTLDYEGVTDDELMGLADGEAKIKFGQRYRPLHEAGRIGEIPKRVRVADLLRGGSVALTDEAAISHIKNSPTAAQAKLLRAMAAGAATQALRDEFNRMADALEAPVAPVAK